MSTRFAPFVDLFLLFAVFLVVDAASKSTLPECKSIPKVLCCTDRVLEKCMSGCIDYVTEKCPHKLERYETIKQAKQVAAAQNKVEAVLPSTPNRRASPSRALAARREAAAQDDEGFIEQAAQQDANAVASSLSQLSSSGSFSGSSSGSQSGDFKLLNQQYPITEVSDTDLTSECGTESSRPPYSPCLSRKTVDDLFLSCCQQHVPSNCHSLCTYEHREHVAAQTFLAAVQQDSCDLKYLSNILYCANQNRDNRKCCEYLGLSHGDLGVGDRCLRMCNIAISGDRLGTVEKNDLVCLSNWNVVMYCARSGVRTIN